MATSKWLLSGDIDGVPAAPVRKRPSDQRPLESSVASSPSFHLSPLLLLSHLLMLPPPSPQIDAAHVPPPSLSPPPVTSSSRTRLYLLFSTPLRHSPQGQNCGCCCSFSVPFRSAVTLDGSRQILMRSLEPKWLLLTPRSHPRRMRPLRRPVQDTKYPWRTVPKPR